MQFGGMYFSNWAASLSFFCLPRSTKNMADASCACVKSSLNLIYIHYLCAIVVNLVSKLPEIRQLFRKYTLLLIGWRVFSP